MRAVQDHYRRLGREPRRIELETIAQTWSEHCKHKTFSGHITFEGKVIPNLLKSTIAAATKAIGKPWCVSVFKDNAGIIEFDENFNVCFKVETHNHPSAIEPYGGANTGLGGVIRDILGCARASCCHARSSQSDRHLSECTLQAPTHPWLSGTPLVLACHAPTHGFALHAGNSLPRGSSPNTFAGM